MRPFRALTLLILPVLLALSLTSCATFGARQASAEIRCVAPVAATLLAQVVAICSGDGDVWSLLDSLAGAQGRDAVACAVAAASSAPAPAHPDAGVGGVGPASTGILDPDAAARGQRWLAARGLVVIPR